MEFCWRARLAGYNVGVAEQSVCQHKYDFKRVLDHVDCIERNRWVTLLTLEKPATLLLILPPLLLVQAGSMLYFIFTGHGKTMGRFLRSLLSAETWAAIRQARRRMRALRRRRDADIVRGFAGPIVFAEVRHPFVRFLVNPLLQAYWAAARCLIFW